jgi:hypothetical protein
VDLARLLMQVAIVALVGGGGCWHLRTQVRTIGGAATAREPSHGGRLEPGSVPPAVSPSVARFFDEDQELLPQFVRYRKEGLLAVDPETLIPTWYPDGEGTQRQRVAEFETTLRAVMVERSSGADAERSEAMRILTALRTLRSLVRT